MSLVLKRKVCQITLCHRYKITLSLMRELFFLCFLSSCLIDNVNSRSIIALPTLDALNYVGQTGKIGYRQCFHDHGRHH